MIERDKYETYETLIKTGQIPQHEVPKLMEENPDFKEWYMARSPTKD